jgi:YfiR/HmsC-like
MTGLPPRRRGPPRLRRLVLALGALLAMQAPAQVAAQVAGLAGEAELKAEWVRRFVLFTEWPASALPAGTALQLCVQGRDDSMQRALAALDGNTLRGHPLQVRAVLAADEARGCHVLYLADSDPRRLFAPAASAATLTIGEAEGFAQAGGAIGLVRENARLRFDVNRAAAGRGGLKLGSELLKNARVVLDGTGAAR